MVGAASHAHKDCPAVSAKTLAAAAAALVLVLVLVPEPYPPSAWPSEAQAELEAAEGTSAAAAPPPPRIPRREERDAPPPSSVGLEVPTACGGGGMPRRRLLKDNPRKAQAPTELAEVPPAALAALHGAYASRLEGWRARTKPCCGAAAGGTTGCRQCTTPALAPGALGRCAVVGLADTALDEELGAEIDAHDTVVRFGYAPTEGYEKHVGSRTDITLVRMHSFDKGCALDKDVWGFKPKPPRKFYLLLDTSKKGGIATKSLTSATREHGCTPGKLKEFHGVPVLYLRDPPDELAGVRDGLYGEVSKRYARTDGGPPSTGYKPTSGFYLVWSLLGADVCSGIDLYGFSADAHSSHYFAYKVLPDGSRVANRIKHTEGAPIAGSAIKPVHVLGAENIAFRVAMASAALCVRGVAVSPPPAARAAPALPAAAPGAPSSCSIIRPEWVEHTAQKISGASVVAEPYEHVQIFDVFHPDMYECMLRNLPPSDRAYSRLRPGVNRFMISLYDHKGLGPGSKNSKGKFVRMKSSPAFDADFWGEFGRTFGNADFRDRWLALFDRTLTLRNPGWREYAARELAFKMELNRDRDGYEIGPHTDSHGKWVTCLYYLPRDSSHEADGGTAVVRSKSGREQGADSTWESWKDPDFEVVRQAHYVPNSVFAFAPCLGSWHAVPKMQAAFTRDTIQTFIMSTGAKKYKKTHCPRTSS